jgi:YYY domain-containing protein
MVIVWRRQAVGAIAAPEMVFWGGSLAILFLRLGRPAIVETEKLMDLGILTMLTRADAFPPPDMWLSGTSLPYYYWGSLVWALPLRLSGLNPAIGYNLVAALIGGSTAVGLWALGARLAGGRWALGATAAFFGVLAGTADGFRQVLAGFGPSQIDLWRSSRQVSGAITEFPLFSFWLGDLHPHVLSLPLAVAAIAVAAFAGSRALSWRPVALASALFGLTWAANPWAMPPTLVAVALMLICGDGRWRWPWQSGWQRWAAALAAGIGGWIISAPFHLGFNPPPHAIKPVFAWTQPLELLLYAGVLLIPTFFVVVRVARGWGRGDSFRTTAILVGGAAVTLIIGAATHRPTTVVLSVGLSVVIAAVLQPGEDHDRPALALVALGLFLFLVPELVYLEDGYGAELHRMNTIFKAYFQGWMLLAATLPVLIRKGGGSERGRRLLLVVMTVIALPHLLGAAVSSLGADEYGLNGLGWMDPGDRAIVEVLREQPPGTTMVEAVGDAYSEYGRLASASGVPTLLGWANHEMVWRGPDILPEAHRRKTVVRSIYTGGDRDMIRRTVKEADIDCVAIGMIEKRDFSDESLDALREAGDDLISCGQGGELVMFEFSEDD